MSAEHNRRRWIAKLRPLTIIACTLLAGIWISVQGLRAAEAGPSGGASYDGFARSSQYIQGRTGTKLAIDIFRPTRGGAVEESPLPVILVATQYHRADLVKGQLVTMLDKEPALRAAVAHGYVVAALDVRAHGASFGGIQMPSEPNEPALWDLHDAIDWLSHQPWSAGDVGTYGCSHLGLTQIEAAGTAPPALKTMVPSGVGADTFETARVGGIGQGSLGFVDQYVHMLDITNPAPPVDADKNKSLLKQAIAEHKRYYDAGGSIMKDRAQRPFRDSQPPKSSLVYSPYDTYSLIPNFAIRQPAILFFSGWDDPFVDHAGYWLKNFEKAGIAAKLVIGPWHHCEWYKSPAFDTTGEHLRWYDHWLKHVPNDVEKTATVRYYLKNAPAGSEWRTAETMGPPTGDNRADFYLAGSPSGAVAPGTDGTLDRHAPRDADAHDQYTVNYEASSTGLATRWLVGPPGKAPSTDFTAFDKASMSYTSEPMRADMELFGYPMVSLWVASSARDVDVFVHLEDVDENGKSIRMSDGALRASNRAVRPAPYDRAGIPWHPSYIADQQPLTPGTAEKLEFHLFPTANFIAKGHRIRIAINSFDKGNWDTPVLSPAPTVSLFRDKDHPSMISLPLTKAKR